MEAGVEGDRRVRKGGSGQINGWRGRRGGTEGHTRPTSAGGGHREKGRGSEGGVRTHRSGGGGARWDRHRHNRAVLEKWSEPEKPVEGREFLHRARNCKRVVEDNEILDVQGGDRDNGRLREGAVAVKPTAHHATEKNGRERIKREGLRKWGLVQEGVG